MPISGPQLAEPFVLSDILAKGLATKPDELALVTNESRWTWRELDAASRRLAANYLALGLKLGDRVASLLPNRGALVVHYLACFRAGLVATPLNYRYQAPEVDHALEVSGAVVLVAHADRDADLALSALAGKLPLGRIAYGAKDGREPALETLIGKQPASSELPQIEPSAPVYIFFTSGSTGKPKGVTHTHETFGWLAAASAAGLALTHADVFFPATSASHIAASSLTFASFGAGVRVDLARTFDGDEILSLLRNTRPTLLCMLPSPLFGLVRDHDATRDDFHSIRMCVSGGDKVSAELEREFTDLAGFTIEELYGMTETGTSTTNPPHGVNKLGSIGKLCPGYEASIRDDKGQEVGVDVPGRLWIRSRANTIGYWNRPDATAETIVDGWLDTGDLVSADADGYLWFRGRKKQIIIHDGSNICPQEVEESLLEHPAVDAAGVIGIHDLVHGENVRAYVTIKPGATRPTGADLMKFSRARVGYKAPSEIVFLDAMPINATGKVDRVALKQLADEGITHGPPA
ncbi:MAG: class I adenylate-forming enzyme family protein [Pirellulales bacterium]